MRYLAFLCVFLPSLLLGQAIVSPKNSDCTNPVIVTDTLFGPIINPIGFGSIQEFNASPNDSMYIEKEHNTVWFKFVAAKTCVLTFDIIPENPKDDFDFMLFKIIGAEKDVCEKIKNKEIKPLRSCISRNNVAIGGKTGLAMGAKKKFVPSGPNDAFVQPILVKKDEIYYLLIDYITHRNGKYRLHFHYIGCPDMKKIDTISKTTLVKNTDTIVKTDSIVVRKINLSLKLFDSEAKTPTNATVLLYFKSSPKNIFTINSKKTGDYKYTMAPNATYILKIQKEGYFTINREIKTHKIRDSLHLKIDLDKIKVGGKITLNNIHFAGGTARILSESNLELQNLIEILKGNPKMKIEIQGHVNGPKQKNTKQFIELSLKRAESVYNYLIQKGIDKGRLSYKGFGNEKMLYPDPKNYEEETLNRRVEIFILEN